MDLRSRLNRPISVLADQVGSDRTWVWRVLTGNGRCSVDLAQSIESATHGAIRAWELLGLSEGPAPVVPETPRDAA